MFLSNMNFPEAFEIRCGVLQAVDMQTEVSAQHCKALCRWLCSDLKTLKVGSTIGSTENEVRKDSV